MLNNQRTKEENYRSALFHLEDARSAVDYLATMKSPNSLTNPYTQNNWNASSTRAPLSSPPGAGPPIFIPPDGQFNGSPSVYYTPNSPYRPFDTEGKPKSPLRSGSAEGKNGSPYFQNPKSPSFGVPYPSREELEVSDIHHTRTRSTIGLVLYGLVVDHVIPGGPAHLSGALDHGDKILAVDQMPSQPENVTRQLIGADIVGTPVEIQALKSETKEVVNVRLFRVPVDDLSKASLVFEILTKLKDNADQTHKFELQYLGKKQPASQQLLNTLGDVLTELMLEHRHQKTIWEEQLELACNRIRNSHQASLQAMEDYVASAQTRKLPGVDAGAQVALENQGEVRLVESLSSNLEDAESKMVAIRGYTEHLASSLVRARQHIQKQNSEITTLQRQNDRTLVTQDDIISKQEEGLVSLEAERDILVDRVFALEAELKQLGEQSSQMSGELDEVSSVAQTQREQIAALEKIVQDQSKANTKLQQTINELQSPLKDMALTTFGVSKELGAQVSDLSLKTLNLEKVAAEEKAERFRVQGLLNETEAEKNLLSKRLQEMEAEHQRALKDSALGAMTQAKAQDIAKEICSTLNSIKEGPDSLARVHTEIGMQYEQVQANYQTANLRSSILADRMEAEALGHERAKRMVQTLEEEIEGLKAEAQFYKDEHQRNSSALSQADLLLVENEDLTKKAKTLETKAAELSKEFNNSKDEANQLNQHLSGTANELKSLQLEFSGLQQRHDELKDNFSKLQKVAERYKQDHVTESQTLKSQLDTSDLRIKELEDQLVQNQVIQMQDANTISGLRDEIGGHQVHRTQSAETISDYKAKTKTIESEVEGMRGRLKAMMETLQKSKLESRHCRCRQVLSVSVLSASDLQADEGERIAVDIRIDDLRETAQTTHTLDMAKGPHPIFNENLKTEVKPASKSLNLRVLSSSGARELGVGTLELLPLEAGTNWTGVVDLTGHSGQNAGTLNLKVFRSEKSASEIELDQHVASLLEQLGIAEAQKSLMITQRDTALQALREAEIEKAQMAEAKAALEQQLVALSQEAENSRILLDRTISQVSQDSQDTNAKIEAFKSLERKAQEFELDANFHKEESSKRTEQLNALRAEHQRTLEDQSAQLSTLTKDREALLHTIQVLKQDNIALAQERDALQAKEEQPQAPRSGGSDVLLDPRRKSLQAAINRPSKPQFHPEGGMYDEPLYINILAPKKDAMIYFTKNLTAPSPENFDGAGTTPLKLLVSKSETIYAVCWDSTKEEPSSDIAEEAYELPKDLESNIGGTGLVIGKDAADEITIRMSLPGGAAALDAVILPGDRLTAIDNINASRYNLAQVCGFLHGFLGTKVRLGLERTIEGGAEGAKKMPIDVVLLRSDKLDIPDTAERLGSNPQEYEGYYDAGTDQGKTSEVIV